LATRIFPAQADITDPVATRLLKDPG
jgi:hypothetical protein